MYCLLSKFLQVVNTDNERRDAEIGQGSVI